MDAIILLTIALGLCLAFVAFFKNKYKYWAKKGVPYLEPSIPFGNQENPLNPKRARFEVLKEAYDTFKKSGQKYAGIYFGASPILLPIDPDLIKNILTKDFRYFQDRGSYYNEKDDPLSAHMFSLGGEQWRSLRLKISPTFSSGKLKNMFGILQQCGEQMLEKIDLLNERNEALDSKDILSRFTTDVIGSSAFGLDCNSFKHDESDFRMHGTKLFVATWHMKMRLMMIVLSPRFSKLIGLPLFDRNLTNFYLDLVKKIVKYREDNQISRNDFLHTLLELKNNNEQEGNRLTIEEIAAQSFLFFLAGFETSSSAMNFCLFELSQNEEIQDKVRKDILDTLKKHDGKFTYESVMEMKYLAQVLDETLRKYPSMPTILRKAVEDYKLPGTDIIIEKGTRVMVSVNSLHNDPEYYPNPDLFDPERFSEENRAARNSYTYLPFGEGPRICIGLRFGLLQSRIGLALILKNYRVKLNPKTVLPLKFVASSFVLQPRHDIFLDTEKI